MQSVALLDWISLNYFEQSLDLALFEQCVSSLCSDDCLSWKINGDLGTVSSCAIIESCNFLFPFVLCLKVLAQNRGRKARDRRQEEEKKKPEGTVFTEEDFQRFEREYFGGTGTVWWKRHCLLVIEKTSKILPFYKQLGAELYYRDLKHLYI